MMTAVEILTELKRDPKYLKFKIDSDNVIDTWRPIFLDPENVTAVQYKEFLKYTVNKHWKHIHRTAGKTVADMDKLRRMLKTLGSSGDIVDRFNFVMGKDVPGVGPAIASALLIVMVDGYGVWNKVSEGALINLDLLPDEGKTKGDTYKAVNEVLLGLCGEVDVTLWQLDSLLYHVVENGLRMGKAAKVLSRENEMAKAYQIIAAPGGKNVIYYGAPGTGKTYGIEQIIKKQKYHRTVFHPDTQNSDFVGALKPVMEGTDVTYKFAPGPFCRALADALLNPSQKVYLVIEELNRAPAAAVFGELFLLLDRSDGTHPPKTLGEGDYDADFPSREMANWFVVENKIPGDRMKIPSNLSIYATMNSADQGVYPLDTAFRRRFEHKYVKIDWTATSVPQNDVELVQAGSDTNNLAWPKFASRLNRYLGEKLSVQEDRFIGPYFVKESELEGKVPGKILIYLWDDLLRHGDRGSIFDLKKNSTYGDISEAVEFGRQIFTAGLITALVDAPDEANSGG